MTIVKLLINTIKDFIKPRPDAPLVAENDPFPSDTEKSTKQGIYPFKSGASLWRAGLVPSFDGNVWRLHAGEKAEVVWQGTIEDAKKQI